MAIISAWAVGSRSMLALVVGAGDDAALQRDDHRADRHLVLGCRGPGLVEGQFHVMQVERVARVGQRQVERRPIGHVVFSMKKPELSNRACARETINRGVEPRGIEPLTSIPESYKPPSVTASTTQPLAHSLAQKLEIDPDLTRVMAAWPTLPEAIRRAMLALIG